MSHPAIPPTVIQGDFGVVVAHPHFSSISFAPVNAGVLGSQESSITWEMTLPQLISEASQSADHVATVNAWRAGIKLGEMEFRWDLNFSSFTVTFRTASDFTAIHVLTLIYPTTAVVVTTSTSRKVLIVNTITGTVTGDDSQTPDNVLIFPAQQVGGAFEAIRPQVQALIDGPAVLFSDETEQQCRNDRNADMTIAIGGAVLATLAVIAAPVSLAVAVGTVLTAGAVGGAAAAKAENTYQRCAGDAANSNSGGPPQDAGPVDPEENE